VAKTLKWNDEHESSDGKFRINSVTQVSGDNAGRVEWFLSEGPLKSAPRPVDSLDEAKELAQAITDGPKALRAFEAERTKRRLAERSERQAAARRDQFAQLLDDPELVKMLRERLGDR